jgi:uncharacterized protein (UPF0332 family)
MNDDERKGAQTHAGVRQMLGLHFVKTKLLSSKNNAFFSDSELLTCSI